MVAVELEARALRRRLGGAGDRREGSARLPLILRTVGVGAVGLPALASDAGVRAAAGVLVTGLAGGCAPHVAPGDLVVADGVALWGPAGEPRWVPPDPALRAEALRATDGLTTHVGRLLTVPRVVGTPEAKADCWRTHRALAVDMESARVLEWARTQGLPALAVRAVADGPADALPPGLLEALTPGGRLRPATLAAWLTRPGLLRAAWRLGRRSRLALDRLGCFLVALAATPGRP